MSKTKTTTIRVSEQMRNKVNALQLTGIGDTYNDVIDTAIECLLDTLDQEERSIYQFQIDLLKSRDAKK